MDAPVPINDTLIDVKEKETERLLMMIAGALYSALDVVRTRTGNAADGEEAAHLVALQSLLEKAGYLTDKVLELRTGHPQVLGGYDQWADIKKRSAPAVTN